MANALGQLFGEIAGAIREKTGDEGKMKPAEFPEKIRGIEGGGDGVDPYYMHLAEAMMTRNAVHLSGDNATMIMKGFKTSDGNTLGTLREYSFAGFADVEGMAFSDVVMIAPDAFAGNSKLKILDITVSEVIPQVAFYPGALNGCNALEALIVRDGAGGLLGANITTSVDVNGSFHVYVPAAYYDTVLANFPSGNIASSRYRKLEDYPAIDNWSKTYTVRFYDGDTLVDTQTAKYGETATTVYNREGYKISWEPSNVGITQDTDCYAQLILDAPFATASFDAMGEVLRTGNAETLWKVGDSREIPITLPDGSTLTTPFEIRKLTADSAIIVSKYAFAYTLLASATTSTAPTLNTSENNYWGNSKVRTLYNNKLYGGLPSDMQALVADCEHYFAYVNTSQQYVSGTATDKLWIPSVTEMRNLYGSDTERKKCEQTASSRGTSAVQYALRDGRNYQWCRPAYVSTSGEVRNYNENTPYSINVAPIAMELKVTG